MSPALEPIRSLLLRVPRASGDEPTGVLYETGTGMCSPRERG